MKFQQKGFAHLGLTIVVVVVLVVISFVGYRIATKDTKNSTEKSNTSKKTNRQENSSTQKQTIKPIEDQTKDWTLVAPKNTDNTFTVKVPKSLLPDGTCKTKEVLLAVKYNTESNDYDCSGYKDALGYASIVFGVSSSSIVTTLGNPSSTEKVILADGKTVAIKSIITASAKGGGGSYTARYVVFEAKSKRTGANYYAVYSTGVGFSDENIFLKDYEAAVTKGWTLP